MFEQQGRQELFIEPEDYYDPLFGGSIFKRQGSPRAESPINCDCSNCSSISLSSGENEKSSSEKPRATRRTRSKKKKQFIEDPSDANNEDEEKTKLPLSNDGRKTSSKSIVTEEEEDTNLTLAYDEKIEEEPNNNDVGAVTVRLMTVQNEEESNSNDVQHEEDAHKTVIDQNADRESLGDDQVVLKKIESIGKIQEEIRGLKEKMENLCPESKQYDFLYCEEMFIKCLFKLDNILAEGVETVRNARKQLVLEINQALSDLECRKKMKDIL